VPGGSFFSAFVSWWGVFVMGALDSSVLFFLPFGIDTLVIYLAARHGDLFWLSALLATAGSLTGAAVTFWIGRKAGEAGLGRFVSRERLERIQSQVRDRGAVALAIPALLPPPFPLTPFILTCGALDVSRWRFFGTLGAMRILRFGVEALLARYYGPRIVSTLQSDTFQVVIAGFIAVAVAGTAASAVLLWRNSRPRQSVRPA
jgi:membrane protein YqaA with SNARE-associated domain